MDASLARGHARAAVFSLPTIAGILARTGPKGKPSAAVFPMRGNVYRKPPKTATIFAAHTGHIHPSTSCFVGQWTRGVRLIVGFTLTHSKHLPIVSRDGASTLNDVEAMILLRTEASVLDFDGSFTPESYAMSEHFTYGVSASLSRHAVQRLLQRGGSVPERVVPNARAALVLADAVQRHAQITQQVSFEKGGTFLLPWKNGALVASATRIRMLANGGTAPHLAVRTYLDERKLTSRDKARLAPLQALLSAHRLQDLASFHSAIQDPSPKGPSKEAWREALLLNRDEREYTPGGNVNGSRSCVEGARSQSSMELLQQIDNAAAHLPSLAG